MVAVGLGATSTNLELALSLSLEVLSERAAGDMHAIADLPADLDLSSTMGHVVFSTHVQFEDT